MKTPNNTAMVLALTEESVMRALFSASYHQDYEKMPIAIRAELRTVARAFMTELTNTNAELTYTVMTDMNFILNAVKDGVLPLPQALHQIVAYFTLAPPVNSWRTIDSAPRDGTHIQIYGTFAGEVNGIDDEPCIGVAFWNDGSTDYPGFGWQAANTDAYAGWWQPIRWKPLPAVPVIN